MAAEKIQEFYSLFSSSSSSPVSRLHPADVAAEQWENAERMVLEVLCAVQPTAMSERTRTKIIKYIQILFEAAYGIKVFPFGSVPLKTYLPDGDIDLSVVCHCDSEHISNILCHLLHLESIANTQIQVKNVHCIHAEVKVIKCLVEGIAVDICFNQTDGLCALSFLEQVDQLIGKDHLFKDSSILVKTWCFYEGRLLGAKNGLISTYALETMVAHIINLFHSSLDSPLAVLYKFLEYYSKFDWEKHCVAIDGVVDISSLPEVVASPPDGSDEMLLSAEFLQKCREAYVKATGINQTGQHPFHVKFLNVIDPLRGNNNIGRSVNKASFHRIRSAFEYSIENLKEILALPVEEVGNRIAKFFETTFMRIGLGNRPDGVSVAQQSEIHNGSENLLDGIQYGLHFHEFGIYQGCSDPAFPEMCDRLGLHQGRFDQNAMFLQANENLYYESFPGINKVPLLGELAMSRGTGTYIPQMAYQERTPFKQSRRRVSRYSPRDVNSDPTNITESAERKAAKRVMEEVIPDTGRIRLEDETEFPPLQGKPCKGSNKS